MSGERLARNSSSNAISPRRTGLRHTAHVAPVLWPLNVRLGLSVGSLPLRIASRAFSRRMGSSGMAVLPEWLCASTHSACCNPRGTPMEHEPKLSHRRDHTSVARTALLETARRTGSAHCCLPNPIDPKRRHFARPPCRIVRSASARIAGGRLQLYRENSPNTATATTNTTNSQSATVNSKLRLMSAHIIRAWANTTRSDSFSEVALLNALPFAASQRLSGAIHQARVHHHKSWRGRLVVCCRTFASCCCRREGLEDLRI